MTRRVANITVNLGRQVLIANYSDGTSTTLDCVIGREGHETEPGTFHVSRKERMHHSRAYGNTPMPFSMFFSSDGKAIHGTPLAGLRSYAGYFGLGSAIAAVGSHGCVGLANDEAETLFAATPVHTRISIVR